MNPLDTILCFSLSKFIQSTIACGLSSTPNHASKHEALSYHEAISHAQTQQAPPAPPASSFQPVLPVSSVSVIQPAPIVQTQVSQLLPTMISIQQTLQQLAQNQIAPVLDPVLALVPAPAIESVHEEPV